MKKPLLMSGFSFFDMLYLLIALSLILIATSIVAVGALLFVGYLFGQVRVLTKMVVEGKRREARLSRDLDLWQTKLLEKSGMGQLRRRVFTPDESQKTPARKFVAPSQAIAELKRGNDTGLKQVPAANRETVPVAIKQEFLTEAGKDMAAA